MLTRSIINRIGRRRPAASVTSSRLVKASWTADRLRSGYRLYFTKQDKAIVLLLCGGSEGIRGHQARDRMVEMEKR
jgi:hypothetical protein